MADQLIRPLNPYRDQTVSKIMARRAAVGSFAATRKAYADVVQLILKTSQDRFTFGKKARGADLDDLAAAFEREFDGNIDPIAAFDGNRQPTRAHPKGEAIERIRIHTLASEHPEPSWLLMTRLYATRKMSVLENARIPFPWVRHAAARLYERYDGQVDADREIGEAILSQYFMLSVATDLILFENLPKRLAIPCKDGMLLGQAENMSLQSAVGVQNLSDRDKRQRDFTYPVVMIGRMKINVKTFASWQGLTFISLAEMKPSQREFVDRWNACSDLFRESVENSSKRLIVMLSAIDPLPESQTGRASVKMPDFEQATDVMRELLTDTRMSYAIGNTGERPVLSMGGKASPLQT